MVERKLFKSGREEKGSWFKMPKEGSKGTEPTSVEGAEYADRRRKKESEASDGGKKIRS